MDCFRKKYKMGFVWMKLQCHSWRIMKRKGLRGPPVRVIIPSLYPVLYEVPCD
jgi:hypothetical protein